MILSTLERRMRASLDARATMQLAQRMPLSQQMIAIGSPKGILGIPAVGRNMVEIEAAVVAAVGSFQGGYREALPSCLCPLDRR